MSLNWAERNDSEEPGDAAFTPEGGVKRGVYLLTVEDPDDPVTAITDILGDVAVTVGDGRLQRNLPKSHPQYPWLYASAINSVKGVGLDTDEDTGAPTLNLQDANPELECPPITDRYVLYPYYNYACSFTPRPYTLIGDENVNLYDGSWYDDANVLTTFEYADEWVRWTDFTMVPQNDYVTGQQGQMQFLTASHNQPNGTAYPGNPRVFLPNEILKFTWYNVPFRYYTSPDSFFRLAKGRINQNDWYRWKAGELLLLGVQPTTFTPVVPELVPFATVNGATITSTEKCCNLELTMLYTVRTGADLPASPSTGNRNHIVAGHNLLFWLGTRKPYYSESTAQVGGTPAGTPSFLSYPFEQLFTDPDS